IAAFVLSWIYYVVLGEQLAAAGEPPAPWKMAVELPRSLILATVVAGLAVRGEIDTSGGGVLLGVALWIGFPFVLWTGAVIHESTPWKLAAIHAGDWLAKLLVVAVIVSVWQ
ncbi:MAG: DUF1761 domain-containing protein, partial [Gaiellaceae bacterium]